MSHASFCLPADLEREERGVPPWSSRGLCPKWLRIRGSPTTRLAFRGLAVVTLRAQRTETARRVRIGDPLRHQLTPRQGEVVSDRRRATAQQTPRVPVQVRLTSALPPRGVAPLRARPALLLGLAAVILAATTTGGQLGAPGDRARGAGSSGHEGMTFRREKGYANCDARASRHTFARETSYRFTSNRQTSCGARVPRHTFAGENHVRFTSSR